MTQPTPILDYATPPPGTPTALKIVAWLFIAGGILSILQILYLFTQRQIHIDTGVLGIFVGPGLLRWSRGWRTCALVLLWFGMILSPILLFMTLSASSMNLNLFGINAGSVPAAIGFFVGTVMFALVIWEYRVLVREDIRHRFGLPPR
jgi:hypothetical protein